MSTKPAKKKANPNRPTFAPCSIKQQLVLKENEVDLFLTGGK